MNNGANELNKLVAATNSLKDQLEEAVKKLNQEKESKYPIGYHGNQSRLGGINFLSPDRVDLPRPSTSGFLWNPSKAATSRKKKRPLAIMGGRKKQPRICTWTHTFVCLAFTNQELIPDSDERAQLIMAGLGEKKIQMPLDADALGIYSELCSHFPKLINAGGFELFKLQDGGGKLLSLIQVPSNGYSAAFLKTVVHNAKIYIRPVQQDLCLESSSDKEMELSTIPVEACLKCQKKVSITMLREHVESCNGQKKVDSNVDGSPAETESKNDVQLSSYIKNDVDDVQLTSHIKNDVDDVQLTSHIKNDVDDVQLTSHIDLTSDVVELHTDPFFYDDYDLPIVYDQPLPNTNQVPSTEIKTISDIVNELGKDIVEEDFNLVIRRSDVVFDALNRINKATFDPRMRLHVEFVGELGEDMGGPTREFFRLFRHGMKKFLEKTGCFVMNSTAFNEKQLLRLGIFCGLCLAQGGGSFNVFSKSVFQFLCGADVADLSPCIEEVPDPAVRLFLAKIRDTATDDELRSIAMENVDFLIDSGYMKPIPMLQLSQKEEIEKVIAVHKVIKTSLAELTQFREGLYKIKKIQDMFTNYSGLLEPFFCINSKQKLTPDSIRQMFTTITFAEKGSNERLREEATYMFFLDYLDECANSETPPSLGDVLSFFTGEDTVPPVGYETVTLNFNNINTFPTSSTCGIVLTLPTTHADNYPDFKRNMHIAVTMHGGFGLM